MKWSIRRGNERGNIKCPKKSNFLRRGRKVIRLFARRRDQCMEAKFYFSLPLDGDQQVSVFWLSPRKKGESPCGTYRYQRMDKSASTDIW